MCQTVIRNNSVLQKKKMHLPVLILVSSVHWTLHPSYFRVSPCSYQPSQDSASESEPQGTKADNYMQSYHRICGLPPVLGRQQQINRPTFHINRCSLLLSNHAGQCWHLTFIAVEVQRLPTVHQNVLLLAEGLRTEGVNDMKNNVLPLANSLNMDDDQVVENMSVWFFLFQHGVKNNWKQK